MNSILALEVCFVFLFFFLSGHFLYLIGLHFAYMFLFIIFVFLCDFCVLNVCVSVSTCVSHAFSLSLFFFSVCLFDLFHFVLLFLLICFFFFLMKERQKVCEFG